jgi:hypothetical protein
MESLKYVGLDVHRDTISVVVLDGDGKLVMQTILATHAAAILDFVGGLRGTVHMTFEEGTHSAWLHDLLVRRVARVVVCDPRQNALLKGGNKSDQIDARKLAELLRAGLLSPVYHGETSTVTLKHLCRSYAALTEDTTRVKGRIKALYRSQAISSAGKKAYGRRHRGEWLVQLTQAGMHRRAELLYEELDALLSLRREARRELIVVHGSVSRTDPRGGVDCARANAASLSHQAAVLGLLRPGAGNAQQRRLSFSGRTTGARQEAGVHSRTQPESQPRSQKPV